MVEDGERNGEKAGSHSSRTLLVSHDAPRDKRILTRNTQGDPLVVKQTHVSFGFSSPGVLT